MQKKKRSRHTHPYSISLHPRRAGGRATHPDKEKGRRNRFQFATCKNSIGGWERTDGPPPPPRVGKQTSVAAQKKKKKK